MGDLLQACPADVMYHQAQAHRGKWHTLTRALLGTSEKYKSFIFLMF
jgi:hypothetical protein